MRRAALAVLIVAVAPIAVLVLVVTAATVTGKARPVTRAWTQGLAV